MPRPGKALNRSADPAKALDDDPTLGQPITPFKMTTNFKVKPQSLPALRFGANYRLRARTVDLAGNSLPVSAAVPDSFVAPANGVQMKYLRFEPVSHPIVVLQQPAQQGGSLERLVIRSRNTGPALDSTPTNESDQRHVAPPRVAERLVEQHGLLDIKGVIDGSANTYNLSVERGRFPDPNREEPWSRDRPDVLATSLIRWRAAQPSAIYRTPRTTPTGVSARKA